MEYLAVYKGRSGCLRALHAMTAAGVPATVVNTPRETGYGCGISLSVPPAYYGAAAGVVAENRDGFSGWWAVTEYASGKSYSKL